MIPRASSVASFKGVIPPIQCACGHQEILLDMDAIANLSQVRDRLLESKVSY
jgi:hypothetical protein